MLPSVFRATTLSSSCNAQSKVSRFICLAPVSHHNLLVRQFGDLTNLRNGWRFVSSSWGDLLPPAAARCSAAAPLLPAHHHQLIPAHFQSCILVSFRIWNLWTWMLLLLEADETLFSRFLWPKLLGGRAGTSAILRFKILHCVTSSIIPPVLQGVWSFEGNILEDCRQLLCDCSVVFFQHWASWDCCHQIIETTFILWFSTSCRPNLKPNRQLEIKLLAVKRNAFMNDI